MQLHDIIKPLDQMSDDELRERLQKIRHNRDVVKPAAKAHAKKAVKKASKAKVNKTENLVDTLSDAEKLALIQQLQGELSL